MRGGRGGSHHAHGAARCSAGPLPPGVLWPLDVDLHIDVAFFCEKCGFQFYQKT